MPIRYLAVVLLLWIAPVAADDASFSSLYVFGDSLSDTGNLAAVRGDFPAPYFQNRVSNGPLAVDVLAERLGLSARASLYLLGRQEGGNYAVAGARARGNDFIDLPSQVVMFLAQQGNDAPERALYVVFIGGNDVRDARDEPNAERANAIVDDAVSEIANNVQLLLRAGARSLLVMNSPDVSLLPENALLTAATGDRFVAQRATRVSERFRVQLGRALQRLQREHDQAWLQEVDVYTASRLIARQAAQFGISNTTEACFSSETSTFHPDCAGGAGFDRFYFFDEIHPSAKVHRLIGEGIYQGLTQAGRGHATARD